MYLVYLADFVSAGLRGSRSRYDEETDYRQDSNPVNQSRELDSSG